MRQCPIDWRSFEKLIQYGINGLLVRHSIGDEFIFKPSDFSDKPKDFLFSFSFDFGLSLHIFIIESKISSQLIFN